MITCSSLQGFSPPPANYEVRGTYQGSNGTFTDRCTSDTTLEEYYCPYETRCGPGMMDCAPFPTGRVESTMYECATRCVDGACE